MWNSSQRIAMLATALVLVGAGGVGLAWFANWFPVEVGDEATGKVAESFDLDAFDWVGTEQSAAGSAADSAAPGYADGRRSSPESSGVFQQQGEPDLFSDPESSPYTTSDLPSEFPAISATARPNSGYGDDGLGLETRPQETIRQASFAENRSRTAPQHGAADLFDPEQSPTLQESRGFPGGVQFAAASEPEFAGDELPDAARFGAEPVDGGSYGNRYSDPTDSSSDPVFNEQFVATEPPQAGNGNDSPFGTEPDDSDSAPSNNATRLPPASIQAEAVRIEPPTRTADASGANAVPGGNTSGATAQTPPGDVELPTGEGPQLDLAQIDRLIAAGDYVQAHRELSWAYWNRPQLKPVILERLEKNAKVIYFSPQPHFLEPHVIEPGELLQKIAPKYQINWQYLAMLNQVDPRRIQAGQKLKVIRGPFSAFVDLDDFELTIHCHGFFVKRYTVGVGRDNSTPIGRFSVLDRIPSPQYTDPEGRVIAGGDPKNPLGTHWIDLGDSYGIHGTINPESIGKSESRGCIRMRNNEAEEVYNFLVEGSEVVIRP